MTDRYLDSVGGGAVSPYTSKANAATDLDMIDSVDAAGDIIHIEDSHSESWSASKSWTFAGTNANPTRFLCENWSASDTLSTGASITITGGSYIGQIVGDGLYVYGVSFIATGGAVNSKWAINSANGGNTKQVYEHCTFDHQSTGSTAILNIGSGANQPGNSVEFRNCHVGVASSGGSAIVIISTRFIWSGGTILSGTNAPELLKLTSLGEGVDACIEGVDLSNMPTSFDVIDGSIGVTGRVLIRNCKLPASWSGNLLKSAPMGFRAEMHHNCDDGDTNYSIWVEDYAGSIRDETTIVRSGGASDGTTSLAWKMTSSANALYKFLPLESPEIVIWNETAGSSVTATIEIVHDSQGAGTGSDFQDDEIWLEAQYLGTSGYPLSLFADNAKADYKASAADHPNSSETWTTTGLTTPVKQYLSVTFTPQEKGFIHLKVLLAKASKVVYVCPKVTIS
jgi:hypothetical protein